MVEALQFLSGLKKEIRMDKKIVLITGVGRRKGLGYVTAEEFGKLEFHVIISARKPEQYEPLVKALNDEGYEAEGLSIDLLDDKSMDDAAEYIRSSYGKLDVLVNNAAMLWNGSMGPVDEIDNDQIRKEIGTNVIGTFIMMRNMHPLLRASGRGRIVNVSSGAGSYHDPVFGILHNADPATDWPVSLYGITKLAVNGITIKAAKEFKKDNILVNAICPGVMATSDSGNGFGGRDPRISAQKGVLWAATLPDDGQTGGFFRDDEELPW